LAGADAREFVQVFLRVELANSLFQLRNGIAEQLRNRKSRVRAGRATSLDFSVTREHFQQSCVDPPNQATR